MGQVPWKWTQINQGHLEGSFWGPKFQDLKLVEIITIFAIIIIIVIIINNFLYTHIRLLLVATIVRVVNHCRLHFNEPHIMKRITTIIILTTTR